MADSKLQELLKKLQEQKVKTEQQLSEASKKSEAAFDYSKPAPNPVEKLIAAPLRAAISEAQKGEFIGALKAAKSQFANPNKEAPRWADIAKGAGVKNELAQESLDLLYSGLTPGPKSMGIAGTIANKADTNAQMLARLKLLYQKDPERFKKAVEKNKKLLPALNKLKAETGDFGKVTVIPPSQPPTGKVIMKIPEQPIGSVTNIAKKEIPGKTYIVGEPGKGMRELQGATSIGSQDLTSAKDAELLKQLELQKRLKQKQK